ncbi:hypothetical protein D3C78_671040 [compost metagenome]
MSICFRRSGLGLRPEITRSTRPLSNSLSRDSNFISLISTSAFKSFAISFAISTSKPTTSSSPFSFLMWNSYGGKSALMPTIIFLPAVFDLSLPHAASTLVTINNATNNMPHFFICLSPVCICRNMLFRTTGLIIKQYAYICKGFFK